MLNIRLVCGEKGMVTNGLRSAGFILVAGTILVLLSLIVGDQMPAETITSFLHQENRIYALSIQDSERNLKLNLAGTRCHNLPLAPAWRENDYFMNNVYDYYRFQITDSHPAEAFARLRCR
jgi:hypothetical protein